MNQRDRAGFRPHLEEKCSGGVMRKSLRKSDWSKFEEKMSVPGSERRHTIDHGRQVKKGSWKGGGTKKKIRKKLKGGRTEEIKGEPCSQEKKANTCN